MRKKNCNLNRYFLVLFFLILNFCSYNDKCKIDIIKPQNQEQVSFEGLVQGKISNFTKGQLFILVHPMDSSLWYVQNKPSQINEDGSWQTLCYFSDFEYFDLKNIKYFEIIAVLVNTELKNYTLEKIPGDLIAKSKIITVKQINTPDQNNF